MAFINKIVGYLYDIDEFFYDIYREVRDWVWPFYLAADFFYELSWIFYYLANNFSDFGDWVDEVVDQLGDILSWSNIRSLIRSWLPDLEDAIEWWDRWWKWVGEEIDDWWRDTRSTVKGWINAAEDWLSDWIDAVERALNTLKAAWDDFKGKIPSIDELLLWFTDWWGKILASIIAWGALTAKEIDSLISSRLKEWLPFFDSIVEFFANPWRWLEAKFIDWFLGPEEE